MTILEKINTVFPPDKQLHLAVGAVICLIFASVFGVMWGVIASGVAGAGKEAYDYGMNRYRASKELPPNHDVDIMDFLATVVGGLLAAACIELASRGGI